MHAPTPQHGIAESGAGGAQEPPSDDGRSTSSESHSDPVTPIADLTVAIALKAEPTFDRGAILAVAGDQTDVLELPRGPAASGRLPEQVLGSFGDYEVIEKIASGGMGVVYLARQKSLRRTVALKMILAGDQASHEQLQRFRQEAEAAAQLDHNGIVPIFEVGEHEGQPFFSMGYVEGGSLSTRIKEGPLPCPRAAELVLEVAGAVSYAHRQGIIHRDLKPSNILLDRDGLPKVSDFGLAKQVSALSHLTRTGQVMGTPSYMAPEQAAGKSHEVGPAADLYSLGALLYCLVTGRPPFQAATPIETLRQVLDQEPVSPRQLNGSVSRDLETICLKCLQKEPAKRYESAQALADDLRRFLAGEPIRARPVGSVERIWRWCWRNPRVAVLSLSFVLSLLVGIMATSYFWVQARREAAASKASANRAKEAQELSERRLYAAEIGRAQQDLSMALVATTHRRLESLRPQHPGDPDLRSFEWHYLERLCQLELRTLRGHTEPVRGVSFSPDGRYLASAGGFHEYGKPGSIRIWDSTTGETIRAWNGHAACANCVAFSPDGTQLATAGALPNHPGDVKLWDVATGQDIRVLPGHTNPVWSLAFSPDGRRLAGASGGYDATGRPLPGEVLVWDLAGGNPVRLLHDHQTAVTSVAWNLDGQYLVSADTLGIVKIWNASELKVVSTLRAHMDQVTSIALSPDGNLLATGSLDPGIRVWDTKPWKTQGIAPQYPLFTLQHSSPVRSVVFSPDSRRLAAGYVDRSVRIWDLTTRRESLALRGHTEEVLSVAFSPDGWRVASGSTDKTVRIWDATTDRRTLPLRDHRDVPDPVWAIAFSPDGRRFASASRDCTVRIWDTASDLVTQTLRGHTDQINGIAFSGDSRWLCSGSWDRTVRIWDAATGELIRTLDGFPFTVRSVAFAANRRWLACAGGDGRAAGAVMMWKLGSDQKYPALPEREYRADAARFLKIAFSPDGQWLAAGCNDGNIQVWNLVAGGSRRTLRGHSAIVSGLAFSPDGRNLVSGSGDGTVKLWIVATAEAKATLTGHTGGVASVAFSPDGLRVATAGSDLALKLWDVRTAQEVLSIPVSWTSVRLVFHPDGRRLALGGELGRGSDHTIAIWDTRELTPELRDQDEARSRVAFLFARPLTCDQVRETLSHDSSINVAVRDQAQALVDAYGQDLARREAEDLIFQYTIEGLLRAEILERLRTDPRLSQPVRRQALALAQSLIESSNYLNRASRAVVRRPDAEPSAYQRALTQAETASRLTPYRSAYQTTLGLAQYRQGKYREAMETLTRADRLHSTAEGGADPADLAFLAMAHHRLGHKVDALATLNRLRTLLEQPARSNQEEANAFRREAEQLIDQEPAPQSQPAPTPRQAP